MMTPLPLARATCVLFLALTLESCGSLHNWYRFLLNTSLNLAMLVCQELKTQSDRVKSGWGVRMIESTATCFVIYIICGGQWWEQVCRCQTSSNVFEDATQTNPAWKLCSCKLWHFLIGQPLWNKTDKPSSHVLSHSNLLCVSDRFLRIGKYCKPDNLDHVSLNRSPENHQQSSTYIFQWKSCWSSCSLPQVQEGSQGVFRLRIRHLCGADIHLAEASIPCVVSQAVFPLLQELCD